MILNSNDSMKNPSLITNNLNKHKPINIDSTGHSNKFFFDTNKNGKTDALVIIDNKTKLKTEKIDKNENNIFEEVIKEYKCPGSNKIIRYALIDNNENNLLSDSLDYMLIDINYDYIWDLVALASNIPKCQNI